MRHLRYAACLLASSVFAQDPVEVASKYYKRVFNNDRVRVLRTTPGNTAPHQHPDSVVIDPTNGSSTFVPAVTHTDDGNASRFIVELKTGRLRSVHGRWYPLDPKFFSVDLDNDQVRVARVKVPGDGSTPIQTQLARLIIFLTRGRVTFRSPETGRRPEKGSPGEMLWFEAGPQQIDNEDNDPVSMVILELK